MRTRQRTCRAADAIVRLLRLFLRGARLHRPLQSVGVDVQPVGYRWSVEFEEINDSSGRWTVPFLVGARARF